jgi:hypothetical protein
MLIDVKYNTYNPNIFTCKDVGSSNFWKGDYNFWKGVIWAAGVAKMGYRWKLGKENKIRFWRISGLVHLV